MVLAVRAVAAEREVQPAVIEPGDLGPRNSAICTSPLHNFRHPIHDRIEDQLPHIAAPTLIARGEHAPICRAQWARGLVSLLPRGQYVEIPGVAHTLCFTAPTELAAVTRAFLDIRTPN